MLPRGITAGVVALALTAAGTASAQERREGNRGDVNVFLRGGVGDYTGGLGDLTDTGPAWGVTLNVQPTTFLGFELGYEGSQNGIEDTRLLEGPSLVRQGGSALLKVSPPFLTAVRPFVGAGLGISYVDVRGQGADFYGSDTMQEVPLAAGIEFNSGALTAGFRTTYRVLLSEDWAQDTPDVDTDGGLLDASLTLGARF
ncbi:outer membrane beta-barrel protein [Pyxidicoccus fallax]|uniref:Outer membrane beta-barrel protein n=1 Tax=Pyxidicoccus fallax TaxID=394095 RepID=A0A848L9L1_9BACT|nr:outer membrane beta-barrel protein [Pyxidicoccus fallax]NMO15226.1 outer membrane beta-barrel protein [Pyxidicoccus fallax]NPC76925.1 outer membrane beta-barrel protein [Pyxidicoccus fallax]